MRGRDDLHAPKPRPKQYKTHGASNVTTPHDAASGAAQPIGSSESTKIGAPITTREVESFDRMCEEVGLSQEVAARCLDRSVIGLLKAKLRLDQVGRATPTKKGPRERTFIPGSDAWLAAYNLLNVEEPHLSLAPWLPGC